MGMLGQWIAKPRGFTEFDKLLNDADTAKLDAIEKAIDDGHLWLEIRDRFGAITGNPDLDKHIREDWYNENDKGWWAPDAAEEIRTEALYQVIQRVHESMRAGGPGARKHVSSYWLCPGSVRHFQTAICESNREIAVLLLTPPERKSEDRPEYETFVNGLFAGPGDSAIGLNPLQFKVPMTKATNSTLAARYCEGRRVRIKVARSREFCRTILSNKDEGDGLVVTIREGRGDAAHQILDEKLTTHTANDRHNLDYPSNADKDTEQDLWVVTGIDRAPETDSVVVPSKVVGAAVRRIKDDHKP